MAGAIERYHQNTKFLSSEHSILYYFMRQKLAVVSLLFVLSLLCLSFSCGAFFGSDPNTQGDLITLRFQPPSAEHPFGTDKFARDVFLRVIAGGRVSLTIALTVVMLSITIGLFYGAISGYFGRWLDSLLMRLLDFFYAFPSIFLIIAIVAIFKPSLWYFVLILSFTGWMEIARLVRAEVLTVKERDFVMAAKGFGFSHIRILIRHILPNCLTPLIVAAPLKIGEIILLESALSFLGIGVQPPTATWGSIISDGQGVLIEAWWISAFPGLFIVLTVLCFNIIGEAFRNYFAEDE